ncbi:MAG: LLM class flavin-dependent oxidoreductase [Streptosporangiales bacterium]|nr:LLM class flavin-dependent oxidoreductase [Streptosporangiales bacterium]
MIDYRRQLRFGVFPVPQADALTEVLGTVRVADEAGLELVGVQDHPYQARYVDTWTLLATIAAGTERIHVFPDVANLPLRPPAVLAKAAASLDLISGGRVELGLGAGAFWEAIRAMDGPVRTPGEAVAALEEAVQVIRLMWSTQRAVRFEGAHYRLAGVHPGPAPAHPIGIWIGAYGPRMLGLIGRVADGWLPSLGYAAPERLPDMHARIDEAAVSAGRDPSSIQRLYNVSGVITDGRSDGFLQGPPEQWIDQLTALATEYGMDSFVFGPDGDPTRQLRRFAEEVAPGVREAVDRYRATG